MLLCGLCWNNTPTLTGCGLGNVLELGVIGEGVVGRDVAIVLVGECRRPESTVETTEFKG